jgi:hypothetical protein
MNSTSSPEKSPEFFMPTAAFRLGLALCAGLAGVAVFGWVARAQVGALEHFEQRTAVGDSAYCAPSTDADGAVMKWAGIDYLRQPEPALKLRDTRMTRVSRDAASGLSLYKYSGTQPLPYPESARFVKAGPGLYFRLSPR